MDRWINERTIEWIDQMDGWMDEWIDEWMNDRKNEEGIIEFIDTWIN